MRALAICLALLALNVPTVEARERQLLEPPKEYVYEPVVPYTVTVVTQERINGICKYDAAIAALMGNGTRVSGCTDLRTNDIYVVDDIKGQLLREILEHEKAHVNGWRH